MEELENSRSLDKLGRTWWHENSSQSQLMPKLSNEGRRIPPESLVLGHNPPFAEYPTQNTPSELLQILERNTHLFLRLRGVLSDGMHTPRRVDYIDQDVEVIRIAACHFENFYLRPLLIRRLKELGVDVNLDWNVAEICKSLGISYD